nr:PREDICTED: eukaryotic translation initiation factor 4E-binding protein 3 isoform X1 [Lepisosteus oculatus]
MSVSLLGDCRIGDQLLSACPPEPSMCAVTGQRSCPGLGELRQTALSLWKISSVQVELSRLGTRIIYDRKFLLDCRNSPVARTPPCFLPQIPGVTVPALAPLSKLQELKEELEEPDKDVPAEDNQFEMDI